MHIQPPAPDRWYLTGPTASGKTEVGIELARLLDAEIISLDSMALYRRMDIGTAKPTPEQRAAVPHHLIDIIEPEQEYSLARYVQAASEQVAAITERGREVLFVGGTPLYLKALLRGIFTGPEADWDFRRQVQREVDIVGSQALHDRLQQVDPLSAAKLHPNDTRRIIRALEVYKITGQPISHMQLHFDHGRPAQQCRVFALQRPLPELNARIHRRVDQMFAQGLVDEVRKLRQSGCQLGRTARQAVGYREVLEHLEGKYDLGETVERVKVRTRRFAKRQRTWLRSLSECRTVEISGSITAEEIAQRIVAEGLG